MGYNGPALQPRDYLTDIDEHSHTNLDSNVAYWAGVEHGDTKRAAMRNMVEGEVTLSTLKNYQSTIDDELDYILGKLRSVSHYAIYLDITPPELEHTDWSVARCFSRKWCKCRCRPSLTAPSPVAQSGIWINIIPPLDTVLLVIASLYPVGFCANVTALIKGPRGTGQSQSLSGDLVGSCWGMPLFWWCCLGATTASLGF